MKFFANAFVLVICVVLGSGCATKALWEEGQFARFHEPASPPNVELFQKGERLLVVYDEETETESDGSVGRFGRTWIRSRPSSHFGRALCG